MTANYFSKSIFLITIFLLTIQNTTAQVEKSSELHKTIKAMDAILFENGFNQCILSDMEPLISNDLEFYHDQGGITKTKDAFLMTIKQNICANQEQKPIRKLVENSTKIFPLYENGNLYGALQNGIHEFFIKESDKKAYLTSTAKFSHLWLKEKDVWKLKRVFSYDHHTPNKSNAKTEIVLSEAVLDTYVGNYSGKNVKANITRQAHLLRMDSGDMKLMIRSESKNQFFANEAPLTFEFISDNDVIVKMIVRENGNLVDELEKMD